MDAGTYGSGHGTLEQSTVRWGTLALDYGEIGVGVGCGAWCPPKK
jgi:hypothetical protein